MVSDTKVNVLVPHGRPGIHSKSVESTGVPREAIGRAWLVRHSKVYVFGCLVPCW